MHSKDLQSCTLSTHVVMVICALFATQLSHVQSWCPASSLWVCEAVLLLESRYRVWYRVMVSYGELW